MIEQLHCPIVVLKTNTLITAYNSYIAPEHALNGEIVELNLIRWDNDVDFKSEFKIL